MKEQVKKFYANTPLLLISLVIVAGVTGYFIVQASKPNTNDAVAISCQETTCIKLTPEGVQPDTVAITVGNFVQFDTADNKKHNIALGTGPDNTENSGVNHSPALATDAANFLSGEFGSGESWRVQFKKVGTYKLYDTLNPSLEILVVVYDPTKPTKIQ